MWHFSAQIFPKQNVPLNQTTYFGTIFLYRMSLWTKLDIFLQSFYLSTECPADPNIFLHNSFLSTECPAEPNNIFLHNFCITQNVPLTQMWHISVEFFCPYRLSPWTKFWYLSAHIFSLHRMSRWTKILSTECPAEQPAFGSACSLPEAAQCPYGEECCCGQCHPKWEKFH